MTNSTITLKAKVQSVVSEVVEPKMVATEKKATKKVNVKGDVIQATSIFRSFDGYLVRNEKSNVID
ncbi:MAG: hypothetical protein KME09_21570 [Pleurocapsa minor HA4230-MV1]|jgi:hypothetical protein|nr:hypothetical protein [Pleurocapsa minor HA4230-MV1]